MPNCHEKQERRVDIYRIIIVQFKIAVNEGTPFLFIQNEMVFKVEFKLSGTNLAQNWF